MEQLKQVAFGIELKLAPDSEAAEMTFTGYGAVFGNVDSYGDVIARGAFKETLREAKNSKQFPAMLLQHGGWGMGSEDLNPIGVWSDLDEDDIGLLVAGQLAETSRGRDAYTLMKMKPRPAITGLSIGYRAKEFSIGTKPDEPRRTIKKVDLIEVSLVTFPANPKARIQSVKSMDSERDFERWLTRDAGFSRSDAIVIINDGYKSLQAKRDAGGGEVNETALAEWLAQHPINQRT